MKATPPTVATIKRLGKLSAFVLSQTPPRGYRIREAAKGLSVLGMVAPVHIVSRNAYQDAQGRGLAAIEFEPDGKAAAEIRELWQWITKKLEKLTDEQENARHLKRCWARLLPVAEPKYALREDSPNNTTTTSGKRPGIKQQTAYLALPVYEQVRRLAFEENTKMHTLLMEGLDRVFKDRGLPSIAELTDKKHL